MRTKSSIIAMTKNLATYYAPDYRFNAVVLGGVYDKRFDNSFVMNYNNHTPFKRMMNVEETTGIFKYLIGEDSTYTTGGVFVAARDAERTPSQSSPPHSRPHSHPAPTRPHHRSARS